MFNYDRDTFRTIFLGVITVKDLWLSKTREKYSRS